MRNNRKGFTLIELLVVIAIIGLLSTLAVVSLNNARKKSRDAKRVSDIKQIQSALELYFNDQNEYPLGTAVTLGGTNTVTLSNSDAGFEDATPTGANVYMGKVPANPTPGGGSGYQYSAYETTWDACAASETCANYKITFTLEEANPNLGAGTTCAASSTMMVCP